MGEESQPAIRSNVPPAIWGQPSRQNIENLGERFSHSTQSFLATLQAMRNRLEGQIEKSITYASPSVVNPFGGFPVVRYWRPSHDFDYSLFTASALEVYMAWRIAGRSDSSIADFDGELLNSLARLFNKLRYQPISSDGSDAAAIAELSLSFKNEVDRLELFCSLTSPKEEMQPPDLPAGQASTLSVVEELDAEKPDAVELAPNELAPATPDVVTQHPQPCRDKAAAVSAADRAKVQAAIDAYREKFNGRDPTSNTIRKQACLGPGKISKIMDERRAAGEWAVPKRNREKP